MIYLFIRSFAIMSTTEQDTMSITEQVSTKAQCEEKPTKVESQSAPRLVLVFGSDTRNPKVKETNPDKHFVTKQFRDVMDVTCGVSRDRLKEVFVGMRHVMQKNDNPFDFYDPEKDPFLLDSKFTFFIFREQSRTVYVIMDQTRWTYMIQNTSTRYRNPKPLAQVEMEHMRSCHVRFMRGKKCFANPPEQPSPMQVRQMVRKIKKNEM